MLYLLAKAALSGLIVAAVSEIAKRSPSLGALVVSLPLVSLLGILWLWHDTGDRVRIAAHAQATFWYVLPSLPLFLIFPALPRHEVNFWAALGLSCAATVVFYAAMIVVLGRLGVRL